MSGTHHRGGTAGQDGTPLKGCVPLCPGPGFSGCPDLSRFVHVSRLLCPASDQSKRIRKRYSLSTTPAGNSDLDFSHVSDLETYLTPVNHP